MLHRSTRTKTLAYVACLALGNLGSAAMMGQSTTATIQGTVHDASAAVVPNAEITATNVQTNEAHSVHSSAMGEFALPNLPIGHYKVTAATPGFKTTVQENVELTVNAAVRVDLTLAVGEQNETVQVSDAPPLVNTYSTELGQLVDNRRVEELPLNGRNTYALFTTLPGVSRVSAPTVQSRDNNNVSVNGQRPGTSNFLLDGGFNNDIWRNQGNSSPNPDAVQEFRMINSNASAEFGRLPGAVINVITKSGTNQLHGSAYEYLRNDFFDAAPYFQKTVNPLKQNQFGGTLGGPVVKNRTFVFGAYEMLRLRTASFVSGVLVPTVAERNGDFRASGGPLLSPAQLDPVAVNILKDIPLPNSANGLSYSAAGSAPVNQWQFLVKGDQTITAKQKLSVSYFQLDTDQLNPLPYPSSFPGYGNLRTQVYQKNLVVTHTWQMSDRFVNEARANFMRRTTPWIPANTKTIRDYGSRVNLGSTPGIPPRIFVNGRFSMGNYQAVGFDQAVNGSDTVTALLGNHNLRLGVWYLFGIYHENGSSAGSTDSSYNSLLDFVQGRSSRFNVDNGNYPDLRTTSVHSFLQDDWKVSPRITLNLGVRYEITTPLVWTRNWIQSFSPGARSTIFPNAPVGMLFYGDPGVSRAGRKTDWNNIAPRVGIAIDPFGNGRTGVRAAYGMYYLSQYGDGIRSGQPYGVSITTFSTPSLVDPWNTANGGTDPFPYTLNTTNPTFIKPLSVIHFGKEAATPYVQQMTLNVQQQLGNASSLQIAYVGVRSRKMQFNRDENQAIYIPGSTNGTANSTTANVNQRRPYNGATASSPVAASAVTYGQVSQFDTGADASYDALQTTFTSRVGQGLTFVANYTWAKTLDIVSGDQYNDGLALVDSTRAGLDKGNSDGQPRQIFSASGLYELPRVERYGFVGKQLLSGWQLNGILTANSGTPFNVTSGVDTNLNGNNNDRPNLIGQPYLNGNRTLGRWISGAAFSVPSLGQNGNLARNSFFGPRFVNLDAALQKNFALTERQKVAFRWEAFNALNHTNFYNPSSNLSSSNFGAITGSGAARVMQFALRYQF